LIRIKVAKTISCLPSYFRLLSKTPVSGLMGRMHFSNQNKKSPGIDFLAAKNFAK
jgi:hypothetical protein